MWLGGQTDGPTARYNARVMNRSLGGPQSRSERFGEEHVCCPCCESNVGSSRRFTDGTFPSGSLVDTSPWLVTTRCYKTLTNQQIKLSRMCKSAQNKWSYIPLYGPSWLGLFVSGFSMRIHGFMPAQSMWDLWRQKSNETRFPPSISGFLLSELFQPCCLLSLYLHAILLALVRRTSGGTGYRPNKAILFQM